MKTGTVLSLTLSVVILAGCSGREEQLEKEKQGLIAVSDSLSRVIDERDQYFDEVVTAINEVYTSLEVVRQNEERITQETGEAEGKFSLSNEKARSGLLKEISDIDSTLDVSRRKINRLQARARSMNKDFAGLEETIRNLKHMLEERETTIAMLEVRVNGLENEIVDKARMIAERDSVIGTQTDRMNEVYFITGTRSELEEKGIIRNEGGFPWGLFGSTTVMVSGFEESLFSAADMRENGVISISGKIDEIVPLRDEAYYAVNEIGDGATDLEIKDPRRFWQDKYLVIITD